MSALSLSIEAIKPLNRWDHSSIRPGPVGSVGDVLITERLKSSLPGDFRWASYLHGNNESLYGSSVTDGQHKSFNSGAIGNKTIDTNWGGRRRFETEHGWRFQDMRAPDKSVEPMMGALPQYSWRNKLATVNSARQTGNLFPIPADGQGLVDGPANGLTRGGAYPRVTDVQGGDGLDAGYPSHIESNTGPTFRPQTTQTQPAKNTESERISKMAQGKRGAPGRIRR